MGVNNIICQRLQYYTLYIYMEFDCTPEPHQANRVPIIIYNITENLTKVFQINTFCDSKIRTA